MKNFYLTSMLLALVSLSGFSQKQQVWPGAIPKFQISTSMGTIGMIGLNSDIDQQVSLGVKFEVYYNYRITGNHYLAVGGGYEWNNHIADGVFSKDLQGKNIFGRTSDLYKQHEMRINHFNVPLLYKYQWLESGSVSIGPYFSYLAEAESKYKIATAKFDDNMEVDNQFNWGIRFDADIFNFSGKSPNVGTVFGLGAQWQVSNYLGAKDSFRPLFVYFRFGLSIR